jgi:predicted lipid-binding transport protein (Tim44 family)
VRPLRALTEAAPPPPPAPRVLLAALASTVGAIVVPATVISFYATITPSSLQVTAFALRVAEPTALATAVIVTGLGARWAAADARRPRLIGMLVGVLAAALALGTALWTGDVDGWTAAAVVLLPLAGLLGGRRAEALAARAATARAVAAAAATAGTTPRTTGEVPRVSMPAVAFEATLVPPTSTRTGETRVSRPDPARD